MVAVSQRSTCIHSNARVRRFLAGAPRRKLKVPARVVLLRRELILCCDVGGVADPRIAFVPAPSHTR